MGLIFTPVLMRHLLGPPGLSGPMASTSWTHRCSKQSFWRVWPASSFPPTPPPLPPLVRATHDIAVDVKKVAQNSAVLASHYIVMKH